MPALYDEDQLQSLKENSARMGESDSKRRAYIKRLQFFGSVRSLIQTPKSLTVLDRLDHDMPNFSEVTDYIRCQIALRKMAPKSLRPMLLPPILLQGPPGVGKTLYAQQLAQVLNVNFSEIAFATTSAAFILKGTSMQWAEGQCGRVFEILADSEHMNPLVLLDEVDKAISSNFPPINALYELLEPNQASRFQDESFTPLTLDASNVIWILTANQPGRIPDAIISRCRVFNVPVPSKAQVRDIAQNVYKRVLTNQPWGKRFDKLLSDEVVNKLSAMAPREMRMIMTEALGRAALSGSRTITVDNITANMKSESACRMGF